ncbi:unnamed protein product [Linum trigynum]|uniref:Uncharacterized protein n=1 Tax=Linum trigynum TaxID=586398 RepID=A0AAV2GRE7_9ROSI
MIQALIPLPLVRESREAGTSSPIFNLKVCGVIIDQLLPNRYNKHRPQPEISPRRILLSGFGILSASDIQLRKRR